MRLKQKSAKKTKARPAILLAVLLVVAAGLYVWHSSLKSEVKVLYFYLPTCPNCQAVKPYMTYLEDKYPQIKFQKYDLSENKGTQDFEYLSKKLGNIDGGVPFAVLADGSQTTGFLGRVEIFELEKAVCEKLDVTCTNQTYEVPPIAASNGLGYHQERGLKPPSKYTCEACCHTLNVGH